MSDFERKARELLAAEYGDDPMMQHKILAGTCRNEELVRAERALIVALTPPEGYVLVPVEPTPKMVDATWHHPIDSDGGIESQNTRNQRIWSAMLAARPEVSP